MLRLFSDILPPLGSLTIQPELAPRFSDHSQNGVDFRALALAVFTFADKALMPNKGELVLD
jgi:hypothetical protein